MVRFLILGLGLILSGCSTREPLEMEMVEVRRENFTPPKREQTQPRAPTKTGYLLTPEKRIPKTVVCAVESDQRQVEMRIKDKGCELVYSKDGNEMVVATSSSGTAHCLKVQDRIRVNLRSAGFECR